MYIYYSVLSSYLADRPPCWTESGTSCNEMSYEDSSYSGGNISTRFLKDYYATSFVQHHIEQHQSISLFLKNL